MSEAANKALVRRWFDEVWNKGQEATIDKLFAENGIAYGLGDTGEGPLRGFRSVRDRAGLADYAAAKAVDITFPTLTAASDCEMCV